MSVASVPHVLVIPHRYARSFELAVPLIPVIGTITRLLTLYPLFNTGRPPFPQPLSFLS